MPLNVADLSASLMIRPISDGDLDQLRQHAESVRNGVDVAHQMRELEHSVVYATVAQLYRKYPEVAQRYENCEEKTLRDMKLVLRYIMYGVMLDDPQYPRDRMLYWFRTILNAFEFGKPFIEDAYRMAMKRIESVMDEPQARLMNDGIDDAIAIFNS